MQSSANNVISPPAAKKRRTSPASKKAPMHSGRWTTEEEQYVEGMITEFDAGLLPIAEGTTLRSFLAKMLNCNPKRISKKYDGNPIYNGKSAYVRSKHPLSQFESRVRQENLLELDRKFREARETMERVESRLQSITGHVNQTRVSQAASAISSLVTPDQDEPQAWQISDARHAATEAEEAASDLLMHLNASQPPVLSSTMEDPSAHKRSLYPWREVQNSTAVAALHLQALATNQEQAVQPQSKPEGQLRTLLDTLQEIRHQRTHLESPPSPPSNREGLLGAQRQTLELPVRQPGTVQQNFQQFLQALQQRQQQQPARTPFPVQSQQNDLSAILLEALQQEQLRQQQQQQSRADATLESVLGSLMRENNPVPQQAPVQDTTQVQPGSNQMLHSILQQLASRGNKEHFQQAVQAILQGLLNQRLNQQQQQQQPRMNHWMNQPSSPALQLEQQQLASLVNSFVNQAQQRVPPSPSPAQAPANFGALIQSLGAVPSPAGSKPAARSAPLPQDTLQRVLMQLQQHQAQAHSANRRL